MTTFPKKCSRPLNIFLAHMNQLLPTLYRLLKKDFGPEMGRVSSRCASSTTPLKRFSTSFGFVKVEMERFKGRTFTRAFESPIQKNES